MGRKETLRVDLETGWVTCLKAQTRGEAVTLFCVTLSGSDNSFATEATQASPRGEGEAAS